MMKEGLKLQIWNDAGISGAPSFVSDPARFSLLSTTDHDCAVACGLNSSGTPGAFWKVLGVKTFLVGAGSHRPPQGGYYTFNDVGRRQPISYVPPSRELVTKRWYEYGEEIAELEAKTPSSMATMPWRLHATEHYEYDCVWSGAVGSQPKTIEFSV